MAKHYGKGQVKDLAKRKARSLARIWARKQERR